MLQPRPTGKASASRTEKPATVDLSRLRCDCPEPTEPPPAGEPVVGCTACGRLLHGSCLGWQPGSSLPAHFVCSNCSLHGFITRGSRGLSDHGHQNGHSHHSHNHSGHNGHGHHSHNGNGRGRPRANSQQISPNNNQPQDPPQLQPSQATEAVALSEHQNSIVLPAPMVIEETLTEDTYPYVIGADAAPLLRILLSEYDARLATCPEISADGTFRSCNFEFCEDAVALPSLPVDLWQLLGVQTDVREIRIRGGQPKRSSARKGLFCAEPGGIELGQGVAEFCGHIHRRSILDKLKPATVTQSFVLFPGLFHRHNRLLPPSLGDAFDLIVDARKHNCHAKFVRRSCRPNAVAKAVLFNRRVHFFLFATKSIRPGEELCLPLDWDYGNRHFRYECACHGLETCLAPDDLLPEGFREAHLPTTSFVDAMIMPSAPPSHPPSLTTPLVTEPAKKLSREERKLQRYIEAIERMEQAERTKRSRSHSASAMTLGVADGSSPEAPSRGHKRPRIASTAAPTTAPKVPFKKRHSYALPANKAAVSFSASMERMLQSMDFDPRTRRDSDALSSPSPSSLANITNLQAIVEGDDEGDVDIETMDDEGSVQGNDHDESHGMQSPKEGEEMPVSSTPTSMTTAEDSTKRLSLTDYLHRRQLSVPLSSEASSSSTTASTTPTPHSPLKVVDRSGVDRSGVVEHIGMVDHHIGVVVDRDGSKSPLAESTTMQELSAIIDDDLPAPSRSPALSSHSSDSSSSRESGEYIEPAPASSANPSHGNPRHHDSECRSSHSRTSSSTSAYSQSHPPPSHIQGHQQRRDYAHGNSGSSSHHHRHFGRHYEHSGRGDRYRGQSRHHSSSTHRHPQHRHPQHRPADRDYGSRPGNHHRGPPDGALNDGNGRGGGSGDAYRTYR